MPKMKTVPVSAAHEAARQALLAAIRPYADKIGPTGMLAVASGLVGQLIAMQDQRTTTSEMAMKIVAANIENANRETIARIFEGDGGNA